MEPTVFWSSPESVSDVKYCVVLSKENNEILTLRVGDFIKYRGRETGVRIDGFSSKGSDERGPIGFFYTPWRVAEQRWANPIFTLRGNSRHIIAYPVGNMHYGEHIDWSTVELLNGGICPTAVAAAVPAVSSPVAVAVNAETQL
jgi:hypothetical protein